MQYARGIAITHFVDVPNINANVFAWNELKLFHVQLEGSMALPYPPKPGTIVICDYSHGFIAPEMVKRRPSVVISPPLRHRGDLCTVVPLSGTKPDPVRPYHYYFEFDNPLPPPYNKPGQWVKGDMLYTVSFKRLHLPFINKLSGTRAYDIRVLEKDIFADIQKCVLCGLGMNCLTKHL